ncbi:MAG: CCC motif membrane protein [Lacibacter sp.]
METNQQQDYLTPNQNVQPPLPNATVSLVLGILSIVICGIGFVLGIIGVVMANKDMSLYANNPGVYSESSYNNTKTGRICSIIGIVVSSLFVVFYAAYMIWIFSMIKDFK